jgi:hypothetical protein
MVSPQNEGSPLDVRSKKNSMFAAVWDPQYGMLVFRGTKMFDPICSQNVMATLNQPTQPADLIAEAHTIHRTSTFAFYHDALMATFDHPLQTPQRFHHNHSRTIASSTLGGLDLYTHDSNLATDRMSIGHFSCLDQFDNDLAFDAQLAFALEQTLAAKHDSFSDEGFFEERRDDDEILPLKSHFSTTTTSTSSYVEVARFLQDLDATSLASTKWSALEAPDEHDTSSTANSIPRRRLRKRRISEDSPNAPSVNSSQKCKYPNLLSSLTRFRKHSSLDERWVCIDLTQSITQRLV